MLLDEHGEAIDADFLRYYQLDIVQALGSPALSWRRFRSLLEHLPRESHTVHALSGDAALWGPVEHLLAGINDRLAEGNWQRAGNAKKRRPKPLPRPGERAQRERTQLTSDQLRARLERQRRREVARRGRS